MQKSDLSDIPRKGFEPIFWSKNAAGLVAKKNPEVLNALSEARKRHIGPNGLPNFKVIEGVGTDIKYAAMAYDRLVRAFEAARKTCMPKVHDETKAAIDVYLKQAKIGQFEVRAKIASDKSMLDDLGKVLATHSPSSVRDALAGVYESLIKLRKEEPRVKKIVDGAARAAGAGAVARGAKKVGRVLTNSTGTVENATKMLDDHKAAIAKQAEDLAKYKKMAAEMPKPETIDKKDRRHAGYTKSYGDLMKAIGMTEEVLKQTKLAAAAMGEPLRR
ncbi:hypothetical protein M1105_03890 [Limibaculum sp. FT325]|uniref:hypothetical protein n=1 Tax=Thermohalobaculum sediminis TaxID=2939436 RepID=UPI0020BF66A4|nr:hypothetical protein [Limibaculum sediminis]MCL5776136.1 hypothetical protein [Limibaculum sediminis]